MTRLNWESDRRNRKQKEYGVDGWPPLAPAAEASNNPSIAMKSIPPSHARSTEGRRVSNSNMIETTTGTAVKGTKRTPEFWLKAIRHSLQLMRSKEWKKKPRTFRDDAVTSLANAVNALRKMGRGFGNNPVVCEALEMAKQYWFEPETDSNTAGKVATAAQTGRAESPAGKSVKKQAPSPKKAAAKAIKQERSKWREAGQKDDMERLKRAVEPVRDRRGIKTTHLVVDHYWGSGKNSAKKA